MRAVADLNQEGLALAVLRSEDFPALAASPQEACLEAARLCDLYLGLFGQRYSAPTAEEYAEARGRGKPCLILVEEGGAREPAQEVFLAQLDGWTEGHFRCTFRTPDDLKYQVARSLRRSLLTDYLQGLVGELGRLPLAPMEEGSVATGDLVRIELLEREEGKKDKVSRLDLREAMRRHPRLLIVGPGGSGKSTALWRLAFDLAGHLLEGPSLVASGTLETPIPVLLRLSRYDGDLLRKVAETLSMGTSAVEASLGQGRIVLLLDGFDELSLKRRFLDDLEQLVRRAPVARFVLTSRPDPALSALQPSVAVPVDLAPLEEAGLASLLTMHLGADGAERLLHSLEDRGLIDPFRLPLMAWLATVAFRASGSSPLPIATGALYERVLGDFLKKWESRRSEDLVDRKIDLKIEYLASLGKEMVRLGTTVLGRRRALSLCQAVIARSVSSRGIAAVEPAQLLDELELQSLLGCSERGVEFWHLSLRDHFAAIWLSRHAKPWKVALLARHARWKEPVIHLASVLDESRSRDFLKLLLRLTPVAILGCALRPFSWGVDWIFLVLRCLTETPHPCDDLKDRFLDRIRNRTIYLSGRKARFRQRNPENVYWEFHSLIGQLGTDASFDYLQQVARPRWRIVGVGQFRNAEAAASLLAWLDGPETRDSIADNLAAACLLKFPSDLLLERVEGFFRRAESTAKARLLSCLSSALHQGARLKERERWCPFVVEIALSDSDEEVRSKACSFLRASNKSGSLPPEAEGLFLDALAHGEASRRFNAAWPLVYSRTVESREALVHALYDEDHWTQLIALEALLIRDRERFPDHVVGFLKRLVPSDWGAPESFAEVLAELIGSFPQVDPANLEKVFWLSLGIRLPVHVIVRVRAVEALGVLALPFTVPLLAGIFGRAEEASLQEKALVSLFVILGEAVLPYLLQGLESPAERVRERAISICGHLTGEAAKAVLPRVRELVAVGHEKVRWVVKVLEERQE